MGNTNNSVRVNTREVINSVFNEILEETKKIENKVDANILCEKIKSLKESVETLRTEMVTEKEQAITDLKESHTAKLKEVEESHTAEIEASKKSTGKGDFDINSIRGALIGTIPSIATSSEEQTKENMTEKGDDFDDTRNIYARHGGYAITGDKSNAVFETVKEAASSRDKKGL